MTKDAIAAEGQARGVPVAPVLEVAEVLASRHFAVAWGVRRRRGRTRSARPAAERVLRDRRRARRLPPPRARARRAQRRSRARTRRAGRRGGQRDPRRATAVPSRPLAGLRVIDFGIIVIGNEIGRLLADQGADVIKIENRAFPDAARVGYGGKLSHSFVAGSRNKRSFGVNLRTPRGCRRSSSDSSPAPTSCSRTSSRGRSRSSGSATSRCAPSSRTSSCSAPTPSAQRGRGAAGSATARSCAASRASRASGAIRRTSSPSASRPRSTRITTARACAPRRCWPRSSGGAGPAAGAYVESAQAELIVNQLADVFLAASLGDEPGDLGAPWGIYPCAGDDEWCVITVRDDEQWRALRCALGSPEWASAGRFDSVAGRTANPSSSTATWPSGRARCRRAP